MAKVIPFKGIRPTVEKCSKIAALPYDVYNREEAKEVVLKNPDSPIIICVLWTLLVAKIWACHDKI